MTTRIVLNLPDEWADPEKRQWTAEHLDSLSKAAGFGWLVALAKALPDATVLVDLPPGVDGKPFEGTTEDMDQHQDVVPTSLAAASGSVLHASELPGGYVAQGGNGQWYTVKRSDGQARWVPCKDPHRPAPIPVTGPGMMVDADSLHDAALRIATDLQKLADKGATPAITAAYSAASQGWSRLALELTGPDGPHRQPKENWDSVSHIVDRTGTVRAAADYPPGTHFTTEHGTSVVADRLHRRWVRA